MSKLILDAKDVATGLKKQFEDGGAFDNYVYAKAGVVIKDEGVHLLAGSVQLLVIFSNDQVFELTVRERK